jgi:Tfp pilus assembly protein PilF
VEVPSDFQTVTLAELYIRQGHLRPAAEVLEAIIRKDPGQEKAAAMLREVWEKIYREESGKKDTEVATELSRWLDNIGRLRGHAA